jgi:endonuclease YncB( thermonuclease family)
LGFDVSINVSIRIKGINAPEINKLSSSAAGKASRDYLVSIIPIGSQVVIHTEKYRQSFTRFIGDVYTEDGRSIAKLMVDAGFAVIY